MSKFLEIPWTVFKVIVRINMIFIVVSIVMGFITWAIIEINSSFVTNEININLAYENYIDPINATNLSGRPDLVYDKEQNCQFSLLDIGNVENVYLSETDRDNLLNINGRNYGDTVDYTLHIELTTPVYTTFGIFEQKIVIDKPRTAICLRRYR